MKKENLLQIVLAVFVAAIFTEVVLFQLPYWMSLGNEEIVVPLDFGTFLGEHSYTEAGDLLFADEDGNNIIQYDLRGLNVPIKNIAIDAECIDGTEWWSNYDGIEYAVLSSNMVAVTVVKEDGAGKSNVYERNCGTEPGTGDVISFHDGGDTAFLTLRISGLKGMQVLVHGIRLNVQRRYSFHPLRFFYLCVLFATLASLFPGQGFWKVSCLNEKGKLKKEIFWGSVIVILFFSLISLWVVMNNKVYLQGDGGFTPYQDLAQALKEGHLYIDELPSEELLALENPYDPVERLMEGVRFKLDYALYQGHYYVYFGIVPCLIFFFPFKFLFGMDVPGWLVVWFLIQLIVIAAVLLVFRMIKRYRQNSSLGLALLLLGLIAAVLLLPSVLGDSCEYYIPMLSAVALFLYGMYFYLRSEEGGRFVALGSVCMALIAGCRPQLVLSAAVALPVLCPLLFRKEEEKKQRICLWSAFLLPYVLVALFLMLYNQLRFGSPLDFGASYNLTFAFVSDLTLHHEAAIAGIWYYLLRLPVLSGEFPYFTQTHYEWSNPGLLANHTSTGGIFMLFPVLILGIAAVFVCLFRKRKDAEKGRETDRQLAIIGFISFAMTLLFTVLTALMGGMMDRYRMDITVFAGFSAACGVLGIADPLKKKEKAAEIILTVLVFLALTVSLLHYAVEGVWWIGNANPEWMETVRSAVEFWT